MGNVNQSILNLTVLFAKSVKLDLIGIKLHRNGFPNLVSSLTIGFLPLNDFLFTLQFFNLFG
jgi:hypothetical protein